MLIVNETEDSLLTSFRVEVSSKTVFNKDFVGIPALDGRTKKFVSSTNESSLLENRGNNPHRSGHVYDVLIMALYIGTLFPTGIFVLHLNMHFSVLF